MADKKISTLTGATTPLAGTEVLPIVQGSATVKVSVANLTAGRAVATAGGSFTDNVTQSTAAKGINFTANTPAAGMTSQLLNWYEEGTWTPSAVSLSGALTSYTSSGRYTRIGRQVTVHFDVTITNNGTGATAIGVSSLPFLALGAYAATGSAVEVAAVGFDCSCYLGGSNAIYIFKYDLTYPGGTNYRLVGTITYPV